MGTLIDSTYHNIFLTPEEPNGTLQVFIKNGKANMKMPIHKRIGITLFTNEAKNPKVGNISVITGELSQEEFNNLVIDIGKCTNKPTFVSFMPIKRENESTPAAYQRYAKNYVGNDPKNYKDFPENIFVMNVFIKTEDNNIKKRTL